MCTEQQLQQQQLNFVHYTNSINRLTHRAVFTFPFSFHVKQQKNQQERKITTNMMYFLGIMSIKYQ